MTYEKYQTLLPLLPNKRETYFVNISTVQLVLYRCKRKLLETCSNSKSSLLYVSVSQTVVRGPQVVLGFCPCGPFRLNISPKKTEKIKLT